MGGGSGTGFWADKFVPTKATKQALKKNFIVLLARSMRCGMTRAWIHLSLDNELLVREGVTAPGAD